MSTNLVRIRSNVIRQKRTLSVSNLFTNTDKISKNGRKLHKKVCLQKKILSQNVIFNQTRQYRENLCRQWCYICLKNFTSICQCSPSQSSQKLCTSQKRMNLRHQTFNLSFMWKLKCLQFDKLCRQVPTG